jgi:hypothetical protein
VTLWLIFLLFEQGFNFQVPIGDRRKSKVFLAFLCLHSRRIPGRYGIRPGWKFVASCP